MRSVERVFSRSHTCLSLPPSLHADDPMIHLQKRQQLLITTHGTHHAGDIGAIDVKLRDEFNNTVADTAPSNLIALIRHETDQDFEPLYLHADEMACSVGRLEYRCVPSSLFLLLQPFA